ncbi:MAG: hypothetical protein JO149_01565 [Gammaproteobacteria bacterium]|nr:hypothetical protein [Gammaproteobacteria bacterium]
MFGHQYIIKKNMVDALSHRYTTIFGNSTDVLADFSDTFAVLEKANCFVFSVVHAAFREASLLNWWHSTLISLEEWNNNQLNLLNEISPTYLSPTSTRIPVALQELTLSTLFEIAADPFIRWSPFKSGNASDLDLLCPGNNQFRIVNAHGEELFIKDRQFPLIGRFSVEKIAKALGDNPGICLVHTLNYISHTINIGCENGKWFIYDPEYQKDLFAQHAYKFLRFFDSKEAAIEEMLKIQNHGAAIAIEMASTQHRVTPSLNLHTEEATLDFINHHLSVDTIFLLAKYLPSVLMQLIDYISTANAAHADEVNLLKYCIASSLSTIVVENWTGAHILIRYAPRVFERLITLINHESSYETLIELNLANSLINKTNQGKTVLHMMIRYAPQAFKNLIVHMDLFNYPLTQYLEYIFTQTWNEIDNEGRTLLHKIAFYAPDTLITLLDYFKNDDSPYNYLKINFADALLRKDCHGITGIYAIATLAPTVFSYFLDYLNKDYFNDTIKKRFIYALHDKNLLDAIPRNAFNILLLIRLVPKLIGTLVNDIETHTNLLDAACGYANGLTLRQQLIAELFFIEDIGQREKQAIFNKLGNQLTHRMINQIAGSFNTALLPFDTHKLTSLSAQAEIKNEIKKFIVQCASDELIKSAVNINVIKNILSLGKEYWDSPFTNIGYFYKEKGINLTIAEYTLVYAGIIGNTHLMKMVFAACKQNNPAILSEETIDKIVAIFATRGNTFVKIRIRQMLQNTLCEFKNEEIKHEQNNTQLQLPAINSINYIHAHPRFFQKAPVNGTPIVIDNINTRKRKML